MYDFNIYVNHVEQQAVSPTSPKFKKTTSQTTWSEPFKKTQVESKGMMSKISPAMIQAKVFAASYKIIGYVGDITGNTVTARRQRLVLGAAGIVATSSKNPMLGAGVAAMMVGDLAIKYQIRQFETNLSADFAKELSGGTVKTGR